MKISDNAQRRFAEALGGRRFDGKQMAAPPADTQELPALGERPELKWLPVDQLFVNTFYQRDTESHRSQALIERIARDFKWAAFGAVVATKRPHGGYDIIDGQHRVAAVRRRGAIESVPAIVIDAQDVADAARAFVLANKDRVAVTPLHIHHTMIVAGDKGALRVKAVCDAAGITIARYSVPRKSMKPGETVAISAVTRCLDEYGAGRLTRVLKFLAETLHDKPGRIRAPVIKALCYLDRETAAPAQDKIAAYFRAFSHEEIMADAAAEMEVRSIKLHIAVVAAIHTNCGMPWESWRGK